MTELTGRWRQSDFASLIGKTISKIVVSGDTDIQFYCADGSMYLMYHNQDCCESVTIEDIDGDIQRLVGQEIVVAEQRYSFDNPPQDYHGDREDFTWTFYVLRTNLDSVTIRWFGESNGYYSERADFAIWETHHD